jgi:hypothetical protein
MKHGFRRSLVDGWQKVLKDLHGRDKNWLRHAGKVMAKVNEREWKENKKAR